MDGGIASRTGRRPHHAEELEHDPEKWVPVFGHDHAQTKSRFFAQIFRPFFAPPARAGGSQLSLNHSGFAAHCHPDSHREQGRVKRCVSSPEMSMKTRAAKFVVAIAASILSSANRPRRSRKRRAGERQMPDLARRKDTGRRPLALPPRTRHRTSVLVFEGRQRKVGAQGA